MLVLSAATMRGDYRAVAFLGALMFKKMRTMFHKKRFLETFGDDRLIVSDIPYAESFTSKAPQVQSIRNVVAGLAGATAASEIFLNNTDGSFGCETGGHMVLSHIVGSSILYPRHASVKTDFRAGGQVSLDSSQRARVDTHQPVLASAAGQRIHARGPKARCRTMCSAPMTAVWTIARQ